MEVHIDDDMLLSWQIYFGQWGGADFFINQNETLRQLIASASGAEAPKHLRQLDVIG